MIGPNGAVLVMAATKPVDFRKGAEGLAALGKSVCSRRSLCAQAIAEREAEAELVARTKAREAGNVGGRARTRADNLLPLRRDRRRSRPAEFLVGRWRASDYSGRVIGGYQTEDEAVAAVRRHHLAVCAVQRRA